MPVREIAKVLEYRRVGAYHALTLVSPTIAGSVRPGQFVEVLAVGAQPYLLRRPFWVHAARPGAGTGSVELVVDAVGPGSRALAAARTHDELDLLGPLGRGFTDPPEGTPCLLVGGGYGSAPLFFLAHRLRSLNCRVDFVLGAATAERLPKVMDAKRLASSLTVTTGDGSAGSLGVATDVIGGIMAHARTRIVYASGPTGMLAAVSRAAAAAGAACQVAVEELMACGTGVCFSCVVPTTDDAEPERPRAAAPAGAAGGVTRACVEGPVLDGARVAWDEIGHPSARPVHTAPQPVTAEELVS